MSQETSAERGTPAITERTLTNALLKNPCHGREAATAHSSPTLQEALRKEAMFS